MRILFYQWHSFMNKGVEKAFSQLGIEYDTLFFQQTDWEKDTGLGRLVEKQLETKEYTMVFSVNFAPIISAICEEKNMIYVSWVYDAPIHIRDLSALKNSCNRIFFFDKIQAEGFKAQGINAFHMPLAGDIYSFAGKAKGYKADVSLVGKLYQTEYNYYQGPLTAHQRGYLDGILNAQMKVYGGYFLDSMLDELLLKGLNESYYKASNGTVSKNDRVKMEYRSTEIDHGDVASKGLAHKNQSHKMSISQNEENATSTYSLSEDSQGRTLSNEQIEYFKDSQVRDENGALKPVYHGTKNDFTVFDINKNKVITFGNGFYFGENQDAVNAYYAGDSGRVLETYLNITNPFVIEQSQLKDIDSVPNVVMETLGIENVTKDSIMQDLRAHGYDGIHYKNGMKGNDVFVAFDSSQIKSVDNTNPTSNPDINMSLSNTNDDLPIRSDLNRNDTYGSDIELDIPIRDDIATVQESVSTDEKTSETVHKQMQRHLDELNNMESVAKISIPDDMGNWSKQEIVQWTMEQLESTGYRVEREGYGEIVFGKKQIKQSMSYMKPEDMETYVHTLMPEVLKKGIEIESRENHKGREYGTKTFAAPVEINGERGNMAVVVKETTKNFYKVHRIVTPDGKVFKFEQKNKAALPNDGGVTANSALAASTSATSNNSISQPTKNTTKISEDFPIREDLVQQSSVLEKNDRVKMEYRSTKQI